MEAGDTIDDVIERRAEVRECETKAKREAGWDKKEPTTPATSSAGGGKKPPKNPLNIQHSDDEWARRRAALKSVLQGEEIEPHEVAFLEKSEALGHRVT